jgi:hypothetical protein
VVGAHSNTDDLLDLEMGPVMVCCKQESPDTIILHNDIPESGDHLRFYTHDEFAVCADAVVSRIEELHPEKAISYEAELEERVKQNLVFMKYRDGRPFCRVILDRPLDLQKGFWVENRSLKFDVIMRNCHWRDCSTRVMIQGCSSALIEDNTFTRISGGLVVNCDVWWLEGGTGHNVVIRNNRFQETSQRQGHASGDAAIIIGPTAKSWPKNARAYAFGNISITGNSISNSGGGAVKINNASQISISDNTIDGLFLERPPAGAFTLQGCEDIKIGPNHLSRCPGQAVQAVDCQNVDTKQ